MKAKTKLSKLIKQGAIITLISFILLEIGLRIAFSFMDSSSHYSFFSGRWFKKEPVVGVWHLPNVDIQFEKSCFSVKNQTNQWGMRDQKRTLEKQDTFRVAVIGDSFVEGYGVEQEQTFMAVLENQIFKDKKVEFLNFGSSGHVGPVQYWLLYGHLIQKFSPDLVIASFLNSNDVTDNYHWYWKDHASLQQRPYLKKEGNRFELFYPEPITIPEADPIGDTLTQAFYLLKKHSYVVRYISSAVKASRTKKEFVLNDEKNMLNVYKKEPSPRWEEAWQIAEEAISRLSKEVRADGTEFLLLNLVAPQQMDPEVYSQLDDSYDILSPNKRLKALADKLDINYFSLYPGFQDYKNQHKLEAPYFSFTCDGHWSPLGHKVAAELLADYLRKTYPKAFQ